jgi:toxin FitB
MLSELHRQKLKPAVVQWFSQRPANRLYLSVLTLGEIHKGIDGVVEVKRRAALLDWLKLDLPNFFMGRILDVDAAVAHRWGRLVAQFKRPLPTIDSLLAAPRCIMTLPWSRAT